VPLEAREQGHRDSQVENAVAEEGEPLVGGGPVLDPGGVRERLAGELVRELVEQGAKSDEMLAQGEGFTGAWFSTKSIA
jgi:hypothetical protein